MYGEIVDTRLYTVTGRRADTRTGVRRVLRMSHGPQRAAAAAADAAAAARRRPLKPLRRPKARWPAAITCARRTSRGPLASCHPVRGEGSTIYDRVVPCVVWARTRVYLRHGRTVLRRR